MCFPNPERSFFINLTIDEEILFEENKLEIPSEEELYKNLTPDDEMIAQGGDLSVERLLLAYDYGIFPWFPFRSRQIYWCAPVRRFVIFPAEIHVSHAMRTLMNNNIYRVTFNTAFDQVIKNCSTVEGRVDEEQAWLGDEMIESYTKLHDLGRAQSVEVWRDDELVGGLYGVTSGSGFIGESMFSLEPNTSKLALISLAKKMQQEGGTLIDCQYYTPHLESMGGRYISYKEYVTILWGAEAYKTEAECPYVGFRD